MRTENREKSLSKKLRIYSVTSVRKHGNGERKKQEEKE